MDTSNFTRSLLAMLAGPLLWAAHFLFIYVLTALVCAQPAEGFARVGVGMLQAIIGIATAATVAAIVWICARAVRAGTGSGNTGFMHWTALALAAYSGYAVILQAVPALLVPPCI